MTTPNERTLAIMATEVFLSCVSDSTLTRDVPERIRLIAGRLLRHYPSPVELSIITSNSNLLCDNTAETFNRDHYKKSFSEEQE